MRWPLDTLPVEIDLNPEPRGTLPAEILLISPPIPRSPDRSIASPRYPPLVNSTNTFDTLIAVASDSTADHGTAPRETASPSIALRTFRMIHEHPYRYTADDVIFTVYADRNAIPAAKRPAARKAFFAKGQACLRCSDLGKKYGWGIHSDAEGRVALVAVETEEYEALASGNRLGGDGEPVTVTYAMRARR